MNDDDTKIINDKNIAQNSTIYSLNVDNNNFNQIKNNNLTKIHSLYKINIFILLTSYF